MQITGKGKNVEKNFQSKGEAGLINQYGVVAANKDEVERVEKD